MNPTVAGMSPTQGLVLSIYYCIVLSITVSLVCVKVKEQKSGIINENKYYQKIFNNLLNVA